MEWLAIFRQSRQPLDGQDLSSVCLHGEEETRANGLAVEKNGAAAADSLLAAQMSSGKPKMVAQEVSQRQTRLHKPFTLFAVDGQLYGKLAINLIFETVPIDSSRSKISSHLCVKQRSDITFSTLALCASRERLTLPLCDDSSSSTRLGLSGISFT